MSWRQILTFCFCRIKAVHSARVVITVAEQNLRFYVIGKKLNISFCRSRRVVTDEKFLFSLKDPKSKNLLLMLLVIKRIYANSLRNLCHLAGWERRKYFRFILKYISQPSTSSWFTSSFYIWSPNCLESVSLFQPYFGSFIIWESFGISQTTIYTTGTRFLWSSEWFSSMEIVSYWES